MFKVPISRRGKVILSRGKSAKTFPELNALKLSQDDIASSPDKNVKMFLKVLPSAQGRLSGA